MVDFLTCANAAAHAIHGRSTMEKHEHLPILSKSEHGAVLSVLWGLLWRDKLVSFTFSAIAWFSCTAIDICLSQNATVMAFALGLVANFATSVLATFLYICTARKVHIVLFDTSSGQVTPIEFADAIAITFSIWWRDAILSFGIYAIIFSAQAGLAGTSPVLSTILSHTSILPGILAMWFALLWVSGIECRGGTIEFV